MMRKLLTAIMCLLLALALPLASLAATEYEVSAVPGDDLASIEAVKDMLDVTSLRFLCGEDSSMLTLALNNADMLHLAFRATADGIFAQSEELNDKPFFFTKEDISALLTSAMEQSGAKPGMASAMTQNMDVFFSQMGETPETAPVEAPLDPEAQLAKMEEMLQNDPALVEFITNVTATMKITEGSYTDPAHDDADSMFEITVTGADLKNLMNSTTLQKFIAASDDDDAEEAKAEFTQMLDQLDVTIPLTMYADSASGKLVAVRIPVSVKGTVQITETDDGKTTTETKEIDMTSNMDYDRLTSGQVANHRASFTMQNKGKELAKTECVVNADKEAGKYDFTASISGEDDDVMKELMTAQGALTLSDSNDEGWFAILAGKTQMTIDYTNAHTGDVAEKSLAIYTRSDAAKIVEPGAADRPLITLKVKVTKNASEDALAAIHAATPEASTQIMKMSEEELTAFATEIQTKAMQLAMNFMGQLPPSVITMFMGNTK